MTVAQRLYLLVFSAVIGLVGVASLAYFKIESVYTAANFANVNVVPSLIALDDLRKNVLRTRLGINKHVLTTESSEWPEIEQTIKGNIAGAKDAIKKYESLIADDKDKALLEQERELFVHYEAAIEPILVASRQNQNEKAKELIAKNIPLAEKLAGTINEHFDYNVVIGNKGAEEGLVIKSSAIKLSMLIALIVIAIVGVMGWLIARNLQRQLGGEPAYAANIVSQIAAGDMTVEVQTKAGDNTSMLAAIKGMVEKLSQIVGEVNAAATNIASAS
jgi:methyl-accepting chemotaxis protein